MSEKRQMIFLVGDNPFHGISHLSQERARARGEDVTFPRYAADLVATALRNGADGFMFSVSETTLSILEMLSQKHGKENKTIDLYALVPYAYEYVRLAAQAGGISGLGRIFAKQVLLSRNWRAITMGVKGVLKIDPAALLKTYLSYEIFKIESSAARHMRIESVFLHEIITDMSLALDMDWLFRSFVDFLLGLGIRPGFETRNFAYLVKKAEEWNIDLQSVLIATPFNKIGFQMNPSKLACEKALASLPCANIIAMSVLASGYLTPLEAFEYIQNHSEIAGVVVGVSKKRHARETFRLLRKIFE